MLVPCKADRCPARILIKNRKYMGIDRAPFLIDKKGLTRGAWRKVKVPGHVEAVLAAAQGL